MNARARIWGIVPAAGTGLRMQAALPKQYLPLRGRPVLLHAVERLCAHTRIAGVLVGVQANDLHWPQVRESCSVLSKFIGSFVGGSERARTVLNGIEFLAATADEMDWVLVHDAVRPCVRLADIDRLIESVEHSGVGGLLATPMSDTVKRADDDGAVTETVSRANLWRALTPQMFRLNELRRGLERALARGMDITDEAGAMESIGVRPRVVAGQADNIKITVPSDLMLADFILAQQERER